MLVHISIAVFILGLIIGMFAIYLSLIEEKKYKTALSKNFFYFLVVTNLGIAINLFYNYFLVNILHSMNEEIAYSIELTYRILASILLIFIFGVFISLFRVLIEEKFSRKYKILLLTIWLLLIITFFIGVKFKLFFLRIPLYICINILIDYLGMILVTFEMIRTLIISNKIEDHLRRKTVRVFSSGFLFIMTLLLCTVPLQIFTKIPNEFITLISSLILLIFNLLLLKYLKIILQNYYQRPATEKTLLESLDYHIKAGNVSDTEAKIIGLICDGFTNKEISDKLFLSLQTIKDYNYRIFKKFNVSNRVQLTGKFLKTL